MEAMTNPLLDIDFDGASGAMIHITGGPALSLRKAYEVLNGVTTRLGNDTHIKLGARIDPDMADTIKLMAIVTGIKSPCPCDGESGLRSSVLEPNRQAAEDSVIASVEGI